MSMSSEPPVSPCAGSRIRARACFPLPLPALAALAAWLVAASVARAQEERIVQEIQVVGLKTAAESAVMSAIRLRKGLPFSQRVADEDIKRLFSLGKFDDISVETEVVPGGIKVIYKLTESPVVQTITCLGNRRLKSKYLKADMNLKVGQVLQYHLLKLDEDQMLGKYHRKGYANAEVRAEVSKDGSAVTFHIQENPRVHIERIQFEGNDSNDSIKDKMLLKQMKTRRKRFPSFFFPGVYDREKVRADVFAAQEYYRDQGWLDATAAHEIQYDDKRERITFTMHVQEGQRYQVDEITIRGNTIFSEPEIRKLLHLQEDKPFLAQALRDDVATFRKLYGEQGYIESKLRHQVVHRPDAPKVIIKFQIDERVRYYIEKIKIGGMQRVQDRIIRRELTIHPSERFNTSLIDDSVRRLKNTGFFEMESADAVAVNYEPGSRPDTKNVLIDVKEGKVGDISFGLGASSNTGLFGDITFTHRNFDIFDWPKDAKDFFSGNAFVGGGHVLSIRLRPGFQRRDYLLSFDNPSVFDSPYSFGTSVYYRQRLWDEYDETHAGGTLSGGRRLARDLLARLTLKLENIDISDVDADASQDAKDADGSHDRVGLELGLEYDKRDSRFLPSKGHLLASSVEGTMLDVKVFRFRASGSKYFTVGNFRGWGKHILSLRGSFGAVFDYGGDVPIFERFFVGGANSLRGFDYRGVGPVDSVTKDQIGGKYMALAGVQYSIPIVGKIVRGHTFLDTGTTDKSLSDLSDLRAAWGVGIEMRFPVFRYLPITFDFGFPIVKKRHDDTEVFTFTMGSAFSF